MNVKTKLVKVLKSLPDHELVDIYNEYLLKENLGEYYIYKMDRFNAVFPIRNVLFDAYEGDFNPNDNYFYYDEKGNTRSFNDLTDEFNINPLADYCITEGDDLGIEEIRKVLDTTEE